MIFLIGFTLYALRIQTESKVKWKLLLSSVIFSHSIYNNLQNTRENLLQRCLQLSYALVRLCFSLVKLCLNSSNLRSGSIKTSKIHLAELYLHLVSPYSINILTSTDG